MINVSEEFKSVMESGGNFLISADMELLNGEKLTLPRSRFMIDGNSYIDGAGASAFPLGQAVCKTITIEIDNYDGKYDTIDFFGARIAISLSLRLSQTIESIVLGQYTVVDPTTQGETILITAADDMYKADKAYYTTLAFPCALSEMFVDACTSCGIAYKTATFNNSDFTVNFAPAQEYTFRQIFGFIATVAGGNARIDHNNYLEIITYKFAKSALSADHSFYNWINLTTETSDVVITGVQTTRTITDTDKDGNVTQKDQTIIIGTDGYVINIENPLIMGNEESALQIIGDVINNKSFRVFSGEYPAYPLAEFMDTISITDRKGKTCLSFISDIDFTFGGATSFANNAEPALRNKNTYQGSGTKAIIEARKLVAQEKTAREAVTKNLSERIASSSGMYASDEMQADGSTIRYLHDKPKLSESSNVIKVTSEVIAFSTDGGKTYPYGITLDGQTIMQLISAEGINFEWAIGVLMKLGGVNNRSGKLQVYDGDNGLIAQVDKNGYNAYGTDDNGNECRALLDDASLNFGKIEDTPRFVIYADYNDLVTGKDTLIVYVPSDADYVVQDDNSISRLGIYQDGLSQLKNAAETAKFNASADGTASVIGEILNIISQNINGDRAKTFINLYGGSINFYNSTKANPVFEASDGDYTMLRNGGTVDNGVLIGNGESDAVKIYSNGKPYTDWHSGNLTLGKLGIEVATGQGTLNSDGSYKTFYFSNVNGSGTSFTKQPVVNCNYGVNGGTIESGDFPGIKIKNVGLNSFQAAYGGSSTGVAYPIFYQAIAI